jgi:hypothetical protein
MPRNRRTIAAALGYALLMLVLAACGGGGDAGGQTSPAPPTASKPPASALATCSGPAIADTGLPADFPIPDGVTFTAKNTAAATIFLDGFAKGDVAGMLATWTDAVNKAGYTVLSTDDEAPSDAEINYESADKSTSGQIAMRDDCGGGGTIAIHVTNRPE